MSFSPGGSLGAPGSTADGTPKSPVRAAATVWAMIAAPTQATRFGVADAACWATAVVIEKSGKMHVAKTRRRSRTFNGAFPDEDSRKECFRKIFGISVRALLGWEGI